MCYREPLKSSTMSMYEPDARERPGHSVKDVDRGVKKPFCFGKQMYLLSWLGTITNLVS